MTCETLSQGRKLLQSVADETHKVYGMPGSRIPYIVDRCTKQGREQYMVLGGNGYRLTPWRSFSNVHESLWFARRMMAEMHKDWSKKS
jgi:hypothetical protein